MNLAVAGLMIPSTSIKETGAFSWACPRIPEANKKRKKMERNIKTLHLFKALSPLRQNIPKKEDCQIILRRFLKKFINL
jgi:hypothetical protein